jgi:predicted nucleic acid-binding Zn ribbon protein
VRAGTLIVVTRSSAWNQEFSFQKGTILRRYRERLGKEFIKDLRCSVGRVRGVAEPSASTVPPEAEVRRVKLPEAEQAQIKAACEGADPEIAQAIRRALTREAKLRRWRLEHGAKACPRCGAAFRTPHDLCPACRQDDATTGEMGGV